MKTISHKSTDITLKIVLLEYNTRKKGRKQLIAKLKIYQQQITLSQAQICIA